MSLLYSCCYKLPHHKAKRLLRYEPLVSFNEGCRCTVGWMGFAGTLSARARTTGRHSRATPPAINSRGFAVACGVVRRFVRSGARPIVSAKWAHSRDIDNPAYISGERRDDWSSDLNQFGSSDAEVAEFG